MPGGISGTGCRKKLKKSTTPGLLWKLCWESHKYKQKRTRTRLISMLTKLKPYTTIRIPNIDILMQEVHKTIWQVRSLREEVHYI